MSLPTLSNRAYHSRFGFSFYKNKLIKLKKNRNQTETGSNRPVLVLFGFFEQNPVKTDLARFFFRFFQFRFGSVRFGFFSFKLIKPNRTGWFFQNFNWLFFFFSFFSLISFLVFLLTPT